MMAALEMQEMAHDVELKTSHDIRHWRACDACGDLGDDRRMIDVTKCGLIGRIYHDACAVSAFTPEEILRLPLEELNKFTLQATGVELMKAILEQCK